MYFSGAHGLTVTACLFKRNLFLLVEYNFAALLIFKQHSVYDTVGKNDSGSRANGEICFKMHNQPRVEYPTDQKNGKLDIPIHSFETTIKLSKTLRYSSIFNQPKAYKTVQTVLRPSIGKYEYSPLV